MNNNMNKKPLFDRRGKSGTYAVVMSLILLAVLVIVNMIVGSLPSKLTMIDTSGTGKYDISGTSQSFVSGIKEKVTDKKDIADKLGVGIPTLDDILSELEKPGRDPRESLPQVMLRTDVMSMEDLREGMELTGTVRNVIDFGAFVDIGVHQDGLVHISQMCDRFIKHPLEVVSVGDIVEVKVLSVDLKKQRIQLTMKMNG